MKKLLSTIAILTWLSFTALFAQNTINSDTAKTIYICAPRKGQLAAHPPLILLKSRNGLLKIKEGYLRSIEPKIIDSISVLKDAASTGLYGDGGKYGVIIITLKEDSLKSKAYRQLKKSATKFKAQNK